MAGHAAYWASLGRRDIHADRCEGCSAEKWVDGDVLHTSEQRMLYAAACLLDDRLWQEIAPGRVVGLGKDNCWGIWVPSKTSQSALSDVESCTWEPAIIVWVSGLTR